MTEETTAVKERPPFLNRTRAGWLVTFAVASTLVLAALVLFEKFSWWKVLVYGWVPLMLVGFFTAVYAGKPVERKRRLSFALVTAAGLVVSAWLVFAEGMTLWKVLVFATVPFTALMFVATIVVNRRVAPYRVVQIGAAVLLNAYILAFLQGHVIYSGFFKSVPQPILNCYGGPLALFACPIGSTQQMIGMKWFPWLPLGVFFVVGALVGRAACAWVCPFGMWQDLLHKLPAGRRKRTKRWVGFGVTAATTLGGCVLLITLLHIAWWKVLVLGWLPFTALLLAVVVRGRFDIPRKLWLGGLLAGVGLGTMVWFRFGESYGVVAAFFGMLVLGLTGRWFAAALTAVAAALISGSGFSIGPLSGVGLGIALGAVGFGLVLLFDKALKVSMPSTWVKYGILALVAGLASYLTIEPWFCKLCPQGTFGAGIPLVLWDPVNALRGMVGWLYWVKVGFLLLVVVAAVGIKRPFCRLVCPIGAIYGFFNKGSLMKMKLEPGTCTDCLACRRPCPMNIDPDQNQNQLECIRCFECTHRCPQHGLRVTA
ncbi:MAG: 4Fe-4S binding protein [candidate division WOR-3 bacterium]|nr:MAG: 4Fe-4S binding protein [candidate division WOR-3 bacterium]